MSRIKATSQFDLSSAFFPPSQSLVDKALYYRDAYAVGRRKPKQEVPVSERYTLSVAEASIYYGIGQTRLRSLIAENPNADYLLSIGNRIQFKRKRFEEFIDNASCI